MQARLIAYVPEGAAIAKIVAPGACLRIGRDDGADLHIGHASVSRLHAELQPEGEAWRLVDLDSKNGSFVNGARVHQEMLGRTCWLRFGDVHCEFSLLDTDAADAQARRWRDRRTQATLLTARIDALGQAASADSDRGRVLLDHSLRAVLELSQCSRGYVLIDDGGRYRVATSITLDPRLAAGNDFSGSLGAVAQALRLREPVAFNDIGQDAWLATRDSVAAAGLRTLVALPLLDGTRPLGAIYADRRDAGPPLTTLDVELLQAFAERCALWIATQREASADHPAPEIPDDWSRLVGGSGTTQ